MKIPSWLLGSWEKHTEAVAEVWAALWASPTKAQRKAAGKVRQRASKIARHLEVGGSREAHRRRRRHMAKSSRRVNALSGRHPKSGRAA